ncbi:hypothetical protein BGZ83_007702 [Gryganskiella cystojenkinii]|nr:hypothetical protein BGZ83_007702 [Gryganskiella cystojenkinii]
MSEAENSPVKNPLAIPEVLLQVVLDQMDENGKIVRGPTNMTVFEKHASFVQSLALVSVIEYRNWRYEEYNYDLDDDTAGDPEKKKKEDEDEERTKNLSELIQIPQVQIPICMIQMCHKKLVHLSWHTSIPDEPWDHPASFLSSISLLARDIRRHNREHRNGFLEIGSSTSSPALPPQPLPYIPWCPRLESLSLQGAFHFEYKDLQLLFETVRATLTDLDLSHGCFDESALELLWNSFPKKRDELKRLNIAESIMNQENEIAKILYSCRGLESFSAGAIVEEHLVDHEYHLIEKAAEARAVSTATKKNNNDLDEVECINDDENEQASLRQQDGSYLWACQGLKVLELCIVNSGSFDQDYDYYMDERFTPPSFFFTKLSSLDQLEVLNLRHPDPYFAYQNPYNDSYDERPLQLTLKKGLDKLKTLKCLRDFSGPGGAIISRGGSLDPKSKICLWKAEEARWAIEHWPRLETVSAVKLDPEARQLLEDRGIDCSGCY